MIPIIVCVSKSIDQNSQLPKLWSDTSVKRTENDPYYAEFRKESSWAMIVMFSVCIESVCKRYNKTESNEVDCLPRANHNQREVIQYKINATSALVETFNNLLVNDNQNHYVYAKFGKNLKSSNLSSAHLNNIEARPIRQVWFLQIKNQYL